MGPSVPLNSAVAPGVMLSDAKHLNPKRSNAPPGRTIPAARRKQLDDSSTPPRLDRILLFLLLALIPFRAFIGESHAFEIPRQFRNLSAVSGPMPGVTFCIIAAIGTVAILLIGHRLWRGGRRYRPTGAEVGILILLVAAGISGLSAGQKHLALIGSADLLAAALYMLVLRQLLVGPWQVRLALTVIAATGGAMVVKCLYQKYYEIPATIDYYEQFYRGSIFSGDSPQAAGRDYDFRQRLLSRSATGYFAHANVLGSYLILVLMAVAAIFMDALRRGVAWAWRIPPILICAGCGVCLIWTQSKGAVAACIIAFGTWLMGSVLFRGRSNLDALARRRSRGRAAGLLWLAFLGLALLVVVRLTTQPAGLGLSMQFRWMYWQAAARMLAAEGPWGVGADNFGRFFTRFKAVECPEEVQSPHSWIVQMALEWGVLGLIGLIILFAGLTRRIVRAAEPDRQSDLAAAEQARPPPAPSGDAASARSIVHAAGGIGLLICAGWSWLLMDAPPGFLYLTLFVGIAPWMLTFVAAAGAAVEPGTPQISDRPLGAIAAPLAAGVFGFLIHTGVDLAFFWSAPATLFFGLLAILLAATDHHDASSPIACPRRRVAAVVFAAGFQSLTVFTLWIARPALIAGEAIETARGVLEQPSWDAYQSSPAARAYEAAVVEYPLDPTAAAEGLDARFPLADSTDRVEALLPLIETVELRDPHSDAGAQFTTRFFWQRYALTRDPGDALLSISAMLSVVSDYPTSPTTHLHLAQLCQEYVEDPLTTEPDATAFRAAAIVHYSLALWLDGQRVFISPLHHFSAQQQLDILQRINLLGG